MTGQRRGPTPDEFFVAAFSIAQAIHTLIPPPPRPGPTEPDHPADTAEPGALDGACERCHLHVHRSSPTAPWLAQVGVINGDPHLCTGGLGGPTADRHAPVGPIVLADEPDEDDLEERGCYCHVTSMPPCAWCVR